MTHPNPKCVEGAPPVVMGFDMSVARTGWAVGDLDGITSGAQEFHIKGKENPALRFHRFDKWAESTLLLQKPDVVIYEKNNYASMKFSQSIYCSVSLSNRLDVHCALLGIRTVEVMPNALKLAFTGCGGKDPNKFRMKKRAAELWPDYDAEKDVGGDIADARALVWCWQNKPEIFEAKPKKAKAPKAKVKA